MASVISLQFEGRGGPRSYNGNVAWLDSRCLQVCSKANVVGSFIRGDTQEILVQLKFSPFAVLIFETGFCCFSFRRISPADVAPPPPEASSWTMVVILRMVVGLQRGCLGAADAAAPSYQAARVCVD